MNLLPDTRKQTLARFYLSRLVVVSALVLSVVLLVHAALVVPSLVQVSIRTHESTAILDGLRAQLAGPQVAQVSARVTALSERATYLAQSSRQGTASSALRAMVGVPHPGIHLTSMSYVHATGPANGAKMTLSGVADTREALRAYVATVSALPYVSQAILPISAYAKETHIEFSLSLVGTFTP